MFYLDAFGWRAFKRHAEQSPCLRSIADHGVIAQLTAAFPSTTAVHTTLIHTDHLPCETGLFEWLVFEPRIDAIIAPLLFSYAGDADRETLRTSGLRPEQLLPSPTIYQQLAAHGVRSHVYQDSAYAASTFSTAMTANACVHPCVSWEEMMQQLAHARRNRTAPAYHLLYYDRIDTLSHAHGPAGSEVDREIDRVLEAIGRMIRNDGGSPGGKTLVLITADHGQIAVEPSQTVPLNRFVPELPPLLRMDRAGIPLVPGGSARDCFIYPAPGAAETVHQLLKTRLRDIADVVWTRDLINQHYFGPGTASDALRERVGEILVLPRDNKMVWWHDPPRFETRHHGMHGGLSREEMEIPLLAFVID